jgi:phosphatidylserine/phosphatidylglycerophosphate/cardiolipin synthase-like enzyme
MPPAEANTDSPESWFLTPAERGNEATEIDRRRGDGLAWTAGNRVESLVHGATYFSRLLKVVEELGPADSLYFTDWRGDPDERLGDGPDTEIGNVLVVAARRGVSVKGLLWRSHAGTLGFSAKENRDLGSAVNAAGGEVLLDQRVLRAGSHHQKLVIVRHGDRKIADIAFVGGIDLCHGRRDDHVHRGDPQGIRMPGVYGERPPWHDVQVAIEGPAVGDLEFTFRERWNDPTPLSRNPVAFIHDLLRQTDRRASVLPPMPADPLPIGTHSVQILRTYPPRKPGYPFAPQGERSIARGYQKALRRARRLIYIEDQFLWSSEVVRPFAEALTASPQLRLMAIVPRFFDQSGAARWPSQVGREEALEALVEAGGDRVSVFDIENREGIPVYVHAKVCVIDDVWAAVGSDNFNRRSWSHDSELSCAVLDRSLDSRAPADPGGLGDGARRYARDLRLELWREHLDRRPGDDGDLIEPEEAVQRFRESANALERWHEGGRRGERPPGRVRPHLRVPVTGVIRLWAEPLYRNGYDPDARPTAMRKAGEW